MRTVASGAAHERGGLNDGRAMRMNWPLSVRCTSLVGLAPSFFRRSYINIVVRGQQNGRRAMIARAFLCTPPAPSTTRTGPRMRAAPSPPFTASLLSVSASESARHVYLLFCSGCMLLTLSIAFCGRRTGRLDFVAAFLDDFFFQYIYVYNFFFEKNLLLKMCTFIQHFVVVRN